MVPKYLFLNFAPYVYTYSGHDISYGVGHSMVACLGRMAMDMGDCAFELLKDTSSSDTKCQLSSPLANSIDGTNLLGVSENTSSHISLEVHE